MSIDLTAPRHRFHLGLLLAAVAVQFTAAPTTAAEPSLKSPLDYLPEHCLAAFVAKPARLVQQTELEILGNMPLLGQMPVPATEFESIVGFAVRSGHRRSRRRADLAISSGLLPTDDSEMARVGDQAGRRHRGADV